MRSCGDVSARCGDVGARCGEVGARRGDVGDRAELLAISAIAVLVKLRRFVTELLIMEIWVLFLDLSNSETVILC